MRSRIVSSNSLRNRLFVKLLTCMLVIATAISCWADGDDDWIPSLYDPYEWVPIEQHPACDPLDTPPDTGVFNQTYVLAAIPKFGYPYHYTLVAGINDTLSITISLSNFTEKEYDLTGKDYGQWFAPQVYQMHVTNSAGPAFRDSTQLGYRVRGWYSSQIRHPDQSKLPARASWYDIKLDVWNLPEGDFQMCVFPTDKIPSDFGARTSGGGFEFYPARDLADSCNGYEGLFWRTWEDSNFADAGKWVDEIMNINPKSVPGWWLKAHNALSLQDTSAAKDAFDSAIEFLNSASDPAMPDSTTRALSTHEKNYVAWLEVILPYYRAQLGP